MVVLKSQNGKTYEVVICSGKLTLRMVGGLFEIESFDYLSGKVSVVGGETVVISGQYKKELSQAIDTLYSVVHDWVCISSGMYDSLYECKKCGKKHMESVDNIDSDRPVYGCFKQ